MPDVDIPAPPVIESVVNPIFMLVFFGTPAIASFVIATVMAVRYRDPLPIASCIGALICSLNEPIFDVLGKIVYAENHPMAFETFGRSIPWFLVLGYVAWVGLLPYFIARWITAGWTRGLYVVSIAGGLSVVGVEVVNLYANAWEYYGEAPLKFFGGVAATAVFPLVAGLIYFALANQFPSLGRAVLGVIVPVIALPMMFASTGLPLYTALYSDLPPWLDYVAVTFHMALVVGAVFGTVRMAQSIRGDFGSHEIDLKLASLASRSPMTLAGAGAGPESGGVAG